MDNIEKKLLEIEKYISSYNVEEILKKNLIKFFNIIDEEQSKFSLEILKEKYRNENLNELRVDIEYFERNIKDIKSNFSKYLWAYDNLLLEEESKRVFIDMLYAKVFMSSEDIEKAYTDDTIYFDENFVGKLNNEIYVDCGGYVGDTVLQFIRQCPDYSKIFVYEPLANLAEECQKKLDYFIQEGSVIFRKFAVYSEEKDLHFSVGCGNGDSTVVENGEMTVHAVRLDDELPDKVSFIKMDIEGSEKDAIIGAKSHIKNDTPIMAICIYHLEDDFWKIPELIYEINKNYIFKIRQHSQDSYSETVLYCIPKDNKDRIARKENRKVSSEKIAKRSEMVLKNVSIWSQEERENVIGEMKARKWYISQLRNFRDDSINKGKVLEDLRSWVEQLEESKKWLVEQLDAQKNVNENQNDYIKKLIDDKSWIESQYNSGKDFNKEQKEYSDKLLADKEWIEAQWDSVKESLKEQKEYSDKLLADKEWIEAQWDSVKESLKEQKEYSDKLLADKEWIEAQWDSVKESLKEQKEYSDKLLADKEWIEDKWDSLIKEHEKILGICESYEQEIQSLKNNLSKTNYKFDKIKNDSLIKKIIKMKKYDI